jgi:hypothetical protein
MAPSESPGKSRRYPGLPSSRSLVAIQISTVSPCLISWPEATSAASISATVIPCLSGTWLRSRQIASV